MVLASALTSGCVEPNDEARTCVRGLELGGRVLVLGGDLQSSSSLGRLETRDGETCLTEVADAVTLGADPALSPTRDGPFVCARDLGLVLRIDPEELTVTREVEAYREDEPRPCGQGGMAQRPCHNPHDVDVDEDGRLWIARWDQTSVAVVDPGGAWAAVDLSAFADADGLPEIEAVRVVGDVAYVAIERLADRGADPEPPARGLVVPIETKPPHAVGEPFELAGRNPFGPFGRGGADPFGPLQTIAVAGNLHEVAEGDGVELVDLAAGSSALLIGEDALSGSVIQIAWAAPDEAYAIVAGPEKDVNPTKVIRFDPAAGSVTRTLAEADGFVHAGLVVVGDHVVVGDRTRKSPALRVFDRASGALVGEVAPGLHAPIALTALP